MNSVSDRSPNTADSPKPNDSRISKLRSKIHSSCGDVSIDGVIHCVVAVIVSIGFTVHLFRLVDRFTTSPVSTEFTETRKPYNFPDVTICPTGFGSELYGRQRLPSHHELANSSRGIKDLIFDNARFLLMLKSGNENKSYPAYPYSTYRAGRLSLRNLAYRSKQFAESHDIVIFCKFNSDNCSFTNFTNRKDEEHFMCLTFSPGDGSVVTRAGKDSGLVVMFFLNSEAFFTNEEIVSANHGFIVRVNNRGEKPHSLNEGVIAPVRYNTEITIDTQHYVKVNRPSHKCVTHLPNVTYVTDHSQLNKSLQVEEFVGSETDCAVELMQQQFVSECNCLATHLPLPLHLFHNSQGVCHNMSEHFMFRNIRFQRRDNGFVEYEIQNETDPNKYYPLLHYIQQHYSLYNESLSKIRCYERVLQEQKVNGINTDDCPAKCRQTKYTLTANRVAWPFEMKAAQEAFNPIFQSALSQAQKHNLSLDDLQFLNLHPNSSSVWEFLNCGPRI